MDSEGIGARVVCYAGYRGEERPHRLRMEGRDVTVVEVLASRATPEQRCFTLRGDDGRTYEARQTRATGAWTVAPGD